MTPDVSGRSTVSTDILADISVVTACKSPRVPRTTSAKANRRLDRGTQVKCDLIIGIVKCNSRTQRTTGFQLWLRQRHSHSKHDIEQRNQNRSDLPKIDGNEHHNCKNKYCFSKPICDAHNWYLNSQVSEFGEGKSNVKVLRQFWDLPRILSRRP